MEQGSNGGEREEESKFKVFIETPRQQQLNTGQKGEKNGRLDTNRS